MKLVLAEKPSVAQSIAKVLGAAKREDGYLEGNGYVVSWCVGHLVELAQPEVYDAKYSKWAYLSELPKGELAILQLISNRLCVAVGDPHRYAETVIELDCGGTVFSTKGKTVVQDGWKALVQKNDSTKSDENVQTLPSVSVGDEMTVSGTEIHNVLGKRRVTKESFERWYASQTDYRTVEDQELDADIMASTYGLPEMARMLGVHRQTIYYIVANEDFELIKVGRYKRATKESFEKWYHNQTRYQLAEDRQERS